MVDSVLPPGLASFWLLHQRVRVVGLTSEKGAGLNGSEGVAMSFDPAAGRYEVQLDGKDKFKFKGANLELVRDDATEDHGTDMSGSIVGWDGDPNDMPAPDDANAVSGTSTVPLVAPLAFASGMSRHGAALVAQGRALALLGQHVGLGATHELEADIRNTLPGAEELFDEGADALLRAVALAAMHEDNIARAVAAAALGELYYCAASANTRNRAPILPRGAPPGDRMAMIQALTDDSISLSRDAIATLENMEARETLPCVRVMKDLGKVLQFRARFGERDDHTEGQAILNQALDIQQRLAGMEHPMTKNVMRLINPNQTPPQEQDEQQELAEEGTGPNARAERERVMGKKQQKES